LFLKKPHSTEEIKKYAKHRQTWHVLQEIWQNRQNIVFRKRRKGFFFPGGLQWHLETGQRLMARTGQTLLIESGWYPSTIPGNF